MNIINENDQIRVSLAKIRKLTENEEYINLNKDEVGSEYDESSIDKSGEEIIFDDIKTVGYLKTNEQLEDQNKTELISSVGEFIKSTTLILDIVSIVVDKNELNLTSETIKNPGAGFIKSISFNTSENHPQLEIISDNVSLDSDLLNLLTAINNTYSDPQIGRNKLISLV